MQRKVTLSKGAYLWDSGDTARTLAVVEKGRLGVRANDKLIGLIMPKMVVGEAALLALDGEQQERTATVVALEDETVVSEYPASMFRQTFDTGNFSVGHLILLTLIGQTCRNHLLVISAHRDRAAVAALLKGEVRALGDMAGQVKAVITWDEFIWTFRYLVAIRDHSDATRTRLVQHLADDSEMLVRASDMMRDLLRGQDVVTYMEEFIAADRERDKWLEIPGGGKF
jgi:CRP-like cAMP-binding protein